MLKIAEQSMTLASISGALERKLLCEKRLLWLAMKRRKNRPTLFFTNFSFWCNYKGLFYLDVENISNLLFFIVSAMADVLLKVH